MSVRGYSVITVHGQLVVDDGLDQGVELIIVLDF